MDNATPGVTLLPALSTARDVEVVDAQRPPGRVLARRWLAEYDNENTRRAYARDVTSWLDHLDALGLEYHQADRTVVAAWARTHTARGEANTTRARRLATLASFYRFAGEVGAVSSSPVVIRRPPTGEAHVALTPALSVDEVRAVLAAADNDRDRLLVLLLFTTGARVSEALALNIEDVETMAGHATVVMAGKGGTVHRVPLRPLVVAALARLVESEGRTTGPMFTTRATGERLSRQAAASMLARLGRRAGVDRAVAPHQFRAAAITAAFTAGESLRDVQDFARHADPRTTRRYDRARGSLDRHLSAGLAAMLDDTPPEATS